VLVVDDNQTNRRVFEAYVASWGMRPEVARDAVEGFALLQRGARTGDPFDVALLDFNMPGENGLELAARVRRSPSLAKTHLILLTSAGHLDGDESDRGIAGHLTKPVRQSRLLDAISAAMAAGAEPGLAAGSGVASARELAPSVHAGARILVAEDQAVNWKLVERMLSRRGLEASNAVDGRQALRMLDAAPYDLVLMDCHMPLLDGYDTAREIRRREADAGADRIPIVAMTANAMLGDREQCLAAGMDDYMAKPISLDALDEVLARWLSPAGSHGDSGVLEQARLSELRTLFPGEEMSTMLRDLVVDVDTELERVDAGASDSDQGAVASAAHRIKNSARMIGAHRLADAAASLGSADGVIDATAVEALRREWRNTRTAIEAEVTEVASG
jgi:CheY-like chemotaxis protein